MKTHTITLVLAVLFPAGIVFAGDTPLHKDSAAIRSWASGVQSISYGSNVTDDWKTPGKALGPAEGTTRDIVCLGRGGQITLTFPQGISNGNGYDFAVFENGFSDTFLELAFVEVSSDGTHFVRFRSQATDQSPVGPYGAVNPDNITGLASKYPQEYGTQFDLEHMQQLYDFVSQGGGPAITTAHKNQLLENFPYLDMNNIQYVRLIDIVGDGSATDAYGNTIYDPFPTIGSAGFDLDAVAVLHKGSSAPPSPPNTFDNWAFSHGLSGQPDADADGDESPDLEEYFLGTDPTNSLQNAVMTVGIHSNAFIIVYPRDPDALGTVTFQFATALANADWTTVTPESTVTNTVGEKQEVEAAIPLTDNAGFYRLRFQASQEAP